MESLVNRCICCYLGICLTFWSSLLSASCIDVMDYKAACDGTTDDSVPLQDAVLAAELIVNFNSMACISVPDGRTCTYSQPLQVLNVEQRLGPGSLTIQSSGGANTYYGGGILAYTGHGNAIEVDRSGVGNGLAFHLSGITLTCWLPWNQNTCQSLVYVGKTYGPVELDHVFLDGGHNSLTGVGSDGALDGVYCDGCAIQVNISNSFIINMRRSGVRLLRTTNATIDKTQIFDVIEGVYISGSGPVGLDHLYVEEALFGVEVTNEAYWTYNKVHISNSEFNLSRLPPYFGGVPSKAQRCLLVTNTTSTLSMGAEVTFNDNKCNLSDGYVFGNAGIAPYGIELKLNENRAFTVDLSVRDNHFVGMTKSAIYRSSYRAKIHFDDTNYASSSYPADGIGKPIPLVSTSNGN